MSRCVDRTFVDVGKRQGLNPRVVVTDGSNLYPGVLAELWSDAEHQLCVFHVIKDLLTLPDCRYAVSEAHQ
jgi:transposase-like protein